MMEDDAKSALQKSIVEAIYARAHEAMVKHVSARRQHSADESRLQNMRDYYDGTVYAEAAGKTIEERESQLPRKMHPGELQPMIDTARNIVLPYIDMCVRYRVPGELERQVRFLKAENKLSSQAAAVGMLAAKDAYFALLDTHPELLKPRDPIRKSR